MYAIPGSPRLQRFEILTELGRGNTGVIYRARSRVHVGGLAPGDEVALKLLHPHLVEHEQARKAFLREARVGMRVRHPHLVRVFAAEEVQGPDGRLLYLVLELLEGETVRHWQNHEGLAGEPTLRTLGAQISGALAALHQAGLLHLDVKPENIMWDEDRAVLMDLGFVRPDPVLFETARAEAESAAAQGRTWARHPLDSAGLVASDALFAGTPAYAAPELLRGEQPGPAADLFALGVTLYECATGLRPFGDERKFGLFEARRIAVVRRPSTIQPRLSSFFDSLVLALLQEDPADRPVSAGELENVFSEAERSAWWQEQDGPEPRLQLVQPDALPFADRAGELAALEAAYRETQGSGLPHLVLLEGREGVGKSRLALELARRIRLRAEATPFLYGRYPRLGGSSVFQALRDALARSLGLAPGERPHGAVRRRLETQLPAGAAQTLLGLLEGKVYTRGRRIRAFLDWFHRLGSEGPVVLLLDDVQQAGAPLWELIEDGLALRVPLLLLLSFRPELDDDCERHRRGLRRAERVTDVSLAALPESEMRALLRRVFEPGELPKELAEDLLRGARGIPGNLTDLLRFLRQRGDLEGHTGALRPTHEPILVPLTDDQHALLQAEIEERGETEQDLLRWLAILTPPVSLPFLAELSGQPETRVARIFARLTEQGWLEIDQGRYRFSRPDLRIAAYRGLSETERVQRHRRAYSALVLSREERELRPGSLAFHAHLAAMHPEALRHGLPLVERRLAQGAYPRAQVTLDQIWEHAEALGWENLSKGARCRMKVARARLLGRTGDHEQEADLLREAGLLAHDADDDALRARVHLGLARHARAMGFTGAARLHLARVRELGGVGQEPGRDAQGTEVEGITDA